VEPLDYEDMLRRLIAIAEHQRSINDDLRAFNRQQVEINAGVQTKPRGIRLRRDNWLSVGFAEELNSGKSSVILQRADRHGILQTPPDLVVTP
jgi:hypothetical protein